MKNYFKSEVIIPCSGQQPQARGIHKMENGELFSKSKKYIPKSKQKSITPRRIIKKAPQKNQIKYLDPISNNEDSKVIEHINSTELEKLLSMDSDVDFATNLKDKIKMKNVPTQLNQKQEERAQSNEIKKDETENTKKSKQKDKNQCFEKFFGEFNTLFTSQLTKMHIDLDLRFKSIEHSLDTIYQSITSENGNVT